MLDSLGGGLHDIGGRSGRGLQDSLADIDLALGIQQQSVFLVHTTSDHRAEKSHHTPFNPSRVAGRAFLHLPPCGQHRECECDSDVAESRTLLAGYGGTGWLGFSQGLFTIVVAAVAVRGGRPSRRDVRGSGFLTFDRWGLGERQCDAPSLLPRLAAMRFGKYRTPCLALGNVAVKNYLFVWLVGKVSGFARDADRQRVACQDTFLHELHRIFFAQ